MTKSLSSIVKSLKTPQNTWKDVGDILGVSKSFAWRIAHGMTDSAQARHALGLPPKAVEVAPCKVCGEVHTLKKCNRKYKKGSRRRLAFDIPADFTDEEAQWLRDWTRCKFKTARFLIRQERKL